MKILRLLVPVETEGSSQSGEVELPEGFNLFDVRSFNEKRFGVFAIDYGGK